MASETTLAFRADELSVTISGKRMFAPKGEEFPPHAPADFRLVRQEYLSHGTVAGLVTVRAA